MHDVLVGASSAPLFVGTGMGAEVAKFRRSASSGTAGIMPGSHCNRTGLLHPLLSSTACISSVTSCVGGGCLLRHLLPRAFECR
jgi:hypothetical protein